MALMIENSNATPNDLKIWKRQWNYLINQIIIQMDYIISERLGLKFASLSYKKGQRLRVKPIDLKRYAGVTG